MKAKNLHVSLEKADGKTGVSNKVLKESLAKIEDAMKLFEEKYGHSIYNELPLKLEVPHKRIPGSRPLLAPGEENLSHEELHEKYGEKFTKALEIQE